MADDERLRIVIEALNAAKGELQQLQKDLDGVGASGKKADTGMKGLMTALKAAGVVAVAVKFAKTANELGLLAAESQRAEAALTNLSGGAQQAEAYINAVQTASKGAISEMDAMQVAITAQTLGVVENASEMERLTRVAITLGQAQGLTATQAIQDMTTALGRQSPMILDNLGITLKLSEAYDSYAASLGKTAADLTDSEKKQAFLNEALAKGEEVADSLGGVMEDNLLAVEQNKAAWADLKVELGERFVGAVAGANTATGQFTRTWKELLELANSGEMGIFEANIRLLTEGLLKVDPATDPLLRLLAPGYKTLAQQQQDAENIQRGWNASAERGAALAEYYAQNVRDVKTETLGLADVTYDSADAWRDYSAAVNGSTDYLGDLRQAQEEVAKAEAAAAEEFKLISWATDQTFGAELDASADTIEQLKQKAADLQAAIAATDDEAEMSNLRGELAGVRADIELVIGSMKEMSAQFVLGLLESQLAASGMSATMQAEILTAYAESLGLVDETAAATSRAVTAILDDVTLTAEEKAARLIELALGFGTAMEDSAREASGGLLDIIAHAEDAAEALRNIGLSAEAAQIMLDRMHGKTIELEVNWIERNRPTTPDGAYITGRNEIGWNAGGGDYIVSQPTVFGAGEAGAERAIFIPQGEPGFDAPNAAMAALAYGGAALGHSAAGNTWNGNIVIQGAGDPQATAGAVMRELQRRGIVPVGGVR